MTLSNACKSINYTLGAFALTASLFFATIANATTYYVATSGNDSNPGTNAQPFRSINEGIKNISSGDRLYIKSGTYSERIDSNSVTMPRGTSWSNAPVIAASPGHTVILRPVNGGEVINLAHSNIRYVIFDRLILDANNVTFGISTTNGANHIRFQNIEVKNASGSGVILTTGAQPAPYRTFQEFINCHIHHNGNSDLDHGLYISTSENLVKGSIVHHNSSFGMIAFNSTSSQRIHDNVFIGNRIYSNSTKASTSAGILLSSGNGNSAINNVIYSSKKGIRVNNNNPTNSKVYNNTIYNGLVGIEVTSLSTGALLRNNISYNNTVNINNQGQSTILTNNLTSNPKFVNASNGDFHLQSGSPAIDAGGTISGINSDHDGTPRPQGNHFDIGAYETKNSSGGNGSTGGNTGGNSSSNSSPPPSSTGSGATSSFKAAHSNKCIEISANSRSTKAKAVQSRCDGQANQQFQLTPVGSNIFQLKASHSGQCLEIAGASRAPGTLLQQNVCTSGNHQRFRISGSSSTLVAVHSGQCVDVAAGLTNDGAKIVQWTCHGGRNQRWTGAIGAPASPPPPPTSTGSGATSSFKAAHSNKCIEISANSRSTKAKAVQSRCDGQANQQFQLTPVGSNIFQLKASHSGQCLEIAGASRAPGTLLQQNVCTSGNHQRFRISGSSSTLVAVHSGQCVDVAAGLTNDGAKIVQWTCHSGSNQRWTRAK